MEVKEVCRLCLTRDNDLVWVFDHRLDSVKYMKDLIFTTTGVEINKEDVISQKICTICGQDVIKLYQFREQSLKNDKLLKELQKKSMQKKIHGSIIQLFSTYPGLKLPNVGLDLDYSPMVEMEMDEVENYFKRNNISMEKHIHQVIKAERLKDKAKTLPQSIPRPTSSISPKETVSPISIKFRQDKSRYEIVHKPSLNQTGDGTLQNEIINLISSPTPVNNLGNHRKRKTSDSEVSSPSKKICESGSSGIKPLIRRQSVGLLNLNMWSDVTDQPISSRLSLAETTTEITDINLVEHLSTNTAPESCNRSEVSQLTPSTIQKFCVQRSPTIISNILLKTGDQSPNNDITQNGFIRSDDAPFHQMMSSVIAKPSVDNVNSIVNADIISKRGMQPLHPAIRYPKAVSSFPNNLPTEDLYPPFSNEMSIKSAKSVSSPLVKNSNKPMASNVINPLPTVVNRLTDNQGSNSMSHMSGIFPVESLYPNISKLPLMRPLVQHSLPKIDSHMNTRETQPLHASELNIPLADKVCQNSVPYIYNTFPTVINITPARYQHPVDNSSLSTSNAYPRVDLDNGLGPQHLCLTADNGINDNLYIGTNISNKGSNEYSNYTVTNQKTIESTNKPTVELINEFRNSAVTTASSESKKEVPKNSSDTTQKDKATPISSDMIEIVNAETKIKMSRPKILLNISKELSPVDPKKHLTLGESSRDNELSCIFCRNIFESVAVLSIHLETCFSRKAVENPPYVLVERIENNQAIRKKYPQTFITFQKSASSGTEVPDVIEILSDEDSIAKDQTEPSAPGSSNGATRANRLSDITPDIEIKNSRFPNITYKGDAIKLLQQLLTCDKNQFPVHQNTQTELSSNDPVLEKLKPMFKRYPQSDSVVYKIDSPAIELRNFKYFLDIYKIPVFIENGERLGVNYNFKDVSPPQDKFNDWSDLTPIDVKIVKTAEHSKNKITSDFIRPKNVKVIQRNVPTTGSLRSSPMPDDPFEDCNELTPRPVTSVKSIETSKLTDTFNYWSCLTPTDVKIVKTAEHSKNKITSDLIQPAHVKVIQRNVPTTGTLRSSPMPDDPFKDCNELTLGPVTSVKSIATSKLTVSPNIGQQIHTEIIQSSVPTTNSLNTLELDIDLASRIDVDTETLKELLDSVNTTISTCDNNTCLTSDTNVSKSLDVNFLSNVDENIRQLLNSVSTTCEPVLTEQLNSDNMSTNHTTIINRNLPNLGLTFDTFGTYAHTDSTLKSMHNNSNASVNVSINNNSQSNVSNLISSIPYTSPQMVNNLQHPSSHIVHKTSPDINLFVNSEKYQTITPGNNKRPVTDNLKEPFNMNSVIDPNTPLNHDVNMSYDQHFQNFINVNVNVYNKQSSRNNTSQVRTQQVWRPPVIQPNQVKFDQYRNELRPPPPPYNSRIRHLKQDTRKAALEKMFEHIPGPNRNGSVQFNSRMSNNYNSLNGYNSSNSYNFQQSNNINSNIINNRYRNIVNSGFNNNFNSQNVIPRPNNSSYRTPIHFENMSNLSMNRQYGASQNSGHTLSDSCNSNSSSIRVRPISDLK